MNLYHQEPIESGADRTCLNPIVKEALVPNSQQVLHSALPFDFQWDHFVDVINNKQEPLCTIDDIIYALLFIEALIKSLNSCLPELIEDVKNIQPDFDSLGLDESVSTYLKTN